MRSSVLSAVAAMVLAQALQAQTPREVLVVVNRKSADSREIASYYQQKRGIPAENLCAIDTAPNEQIDRKTYDDQVEAVVGKFLTAHRLSEQILYIVLTKGVPLRVLGEGAALQSQAASVDSELTLLYRKLHGGIVALPGPVDNPFFRQRDTPFRHPQFPMYLVTRLDGWDVKEVKGLIDKALAARNRGKFVIDLREDDSTPGNQWLRAAALLLPKDRVVLDDSPKVVSGVADVIGYASWGSNDRARTERFLHLGWLPGAIATEYVSSDARTMRKPPDVWRIGTWDHPATWFADSPQSLTADYIHEGATGASGQVDEPYLTFCPRPEFILPSYFLGRNLAESYYLGIPGLSWMNVVIGDPLTRLAP